MNARILSVSKPAKEKVMKNTEFLEGRFWLESDPKDIIPGKIEVIEGNKIKLKLYGHYKSLPYDPYDKNIRNIAREKIILGVTERYGKVTLLNNRGPYPQSSGVSEIEIRNWIFYSEYLFIGEWFHSIDEICFGHFRVHFSCSEKWITTNSIQYEFREHKILYQPYEENYEIDIKHPYQFRLKILSTANPCFGFDEFSLKKQIYFEILVNEKKDLEWFDEVTRTIQRFLCFFIGTPVYADSRELLIEQKLQNAQEYKDYKLPIKVFSELFLSRDCEFNYRTVKAPFCEIALHLGNYIKNWFMLYENMKPAINLYLANYFIKDMYLEQQFLSLVQAAETIHIRKYGNQRLSYERKGKKRSSKKTPNLWERLEFSIHQYWDEYLCEFVERDVFEDLLVNKVDLCRNYLTHHDLKTERKVFRMFKNQRNYAVSLIKMSLGLNLLITVIFMDFIGIPKKMICKMKNRTEDFQDINEYLKRR